MHIHLLLQRKSDPAEDIEDSVSGQNTLHTFFKVSMHIAFNAGCSRFCAVAQTLLNVSLSF